MLRFQQTELVSSIASDTLGTANGATTHPSARQTCGEVVAWRRKHQSRYEPQWDERDTKGNLCAYEKYLDEIALQIAWGGARELQAAADRWLVRTNVLTERGSHEGY